MCNSLSALFNSLMHLKDNACVIYVTAESEKRLKASFENNFDMRGFQ